MRKATILLLFPALCITHLVCRPALAQHVLGPQPTLVVLARFSDTSDARLNESFSASYVRGLLDQMDDYYRQNSYGRLWPQGVAQPEEAGDILGPYTLAGQTTCDRREIQESVVQTIDGFTDFSRYRHLLIVTPLEHPDGSNCITDTAASLSETVTTDDGEVPLRTAWIRAPQDIRLDVFAHEFGHHLGLEHANFLACLPEEPGPDCQSIEYGDRYSMMGYHPYGFHFNAPEKARLGWLEDQLVDVAQSGRFELTPLESPRSAVKALRIPRGSDQWLFVEYRQPYGGFPLRRIGNVFEGALLHVVDSARNYQTWLFDPGEGTGISTDSALLPGQTFKDPATGTTVTVADRTDATLTVDVVMGKQEFTPPDLTPVEPQAEAVLSGTVPARVTASDSSGIDKVSFFHSRAWGGPVVTPLRPLAVDETHPYGVDIDTRFLPNGRRWIVACAVDGAGLPFNAPGNRTCEGTPVTIDNVDVLAPRATVTDPVPGSTRVSFKRELAVTVEAEDNDGIARVEVYIDDHVLLGAEEIPGDSLRKTVTVRGIIDPGVQNGEHQLYAIAYDAAGNSGASEQVRVSLRYPRLEIDTSSFDSVWHADTPVSIAWSSEQIGQAGLITAVLTGPNNNQYPLGDFSNDGEQVITVPSVPSGIYQVKLTAESRLFGGTVFDRSQPFRIVNLPVVSGVSGRAKDGHLNLVWDAVAEASEYSVYRRTDGQTNARFIGRSQTTVFVDDLPADAQWAEYQVAARDDTGEGPRSAPVRVERTRRTRR